MTTDADADGGTDGRTNAESSGEIEAYADLGATTENAMAIAESSMDRVRELVPDETLADRLRGKAVHATGDPEFQHLLRFTGANENEPVRAGAHAVREERPIVTDITMVKAGITGRGHDCSVRKAIGSGSDLAERTGMTRTAASVSNSTARASTTARSPWSATPPWRRSRSRTASNPGPDRRS